MMNRHLLDIAIETFRAGATGAVFIYLVLLRKRTDLGNYQGWFCITAGFGLIFLGTLFDITDNFPALSRFLIIGETGYEAFLEKVAGFTLGTLLLAYGFWKCLPTLLALQDAKEKLRTSERYYQDLIENSFDISAVLNRTGDAQYLSPSFSRIVGYSPQELIGKNVFDFVHPEDINKTLKAFQTTMEQPGEFQNQELRFRHQDGSWRILEAIGKYVDGTPSGRIFVNARDLTDRRRAEQEIHDLGLEWQRTFDSINSAVFLLTVEGRITRANKAAALLVGKTLDEITGRPCWEVIHNRTEPMPECPLAALRKTRQRQGLILARGDRWFQITLDPLLDNQGNLTGVINILDDITGKKSSEEQLRRNQNLESLGILAGGIAHDFNNLFQGILGNISLAKLYTPAESKALECLESAESLYSAARVLTNQLLAFASGGVSFRETIHPAKLIGDTVVFALSGSNLKPTFDLADDLVEITVDVSQLSQVLSNIVCNAREAMPAGGSLLITAANECFRSKNEYLALEPGDYLRISIQDHGPGIPPAILSRIFDPYYSTKERGAQKGMGLGLPISDTIIRKHGGCIQVDSEIGRGTTLHIYLPAAGSEARKTAPDLVPGVAASERGDRILVMDDELHVSKVAASYLRLSGYRVDTVANGEEAIAAYRTALETTDPYAAVVLDLTIPGGMGGKKAITILREIDPEIRAIVSSGYANDPVFSDYTSFGFTAGIAKPYRPEALKELIDKLVPGGGPR